MAFVETIKAFLKGILLRIAGIFALALLISSILLILNIELDINNVFSTIYSYGGSVNIKFHTIPSLTTTTKKS